MNAISNKKKYYAWILSIIVIVISLLSITNLTSHRILYYKWRLFNDDMYTYEDKKITLPPMWWVTGEEDGFLQLARFITKPREDTLLVFLKAKSIPYETITNKWQHLGSGPDAPTRVGDVRKIHVQNILALEATYAQQKDLSKKNNTESYLFSLPHAGTTLTVVNKPPEYKELVYEIFPAIRNIEHQ